VKIPFRLLAAHSRRNWFRTLLTFGSVFVAVTIFGFLRTVIVGLETSLAQCSESRVVTASAISLFAHLPVRLLPEIEASNRDLGVRTVSHWTWYGGMYKDHSPEHFWGRFGTDPATMRTCYGSDIDLPDEAWKRWEETPTGCIIGTQLAADEKLAVGDRVRIEGNLFAGRIDLEVVGIYKSRVRSFDDKTLFFHWNYLNESSKAAGGRHDCVSTFVLLLDDPSKAAQVCRNVDAAYEGSSNRTRSQSERIFQEQFNSMWGNLPLFFTILGTVVMVACLMVTANTMTINARERVQEVGVLKTLGFTPATVVAMTLVEGVLLCGLAGALSMALLRLQDGKMLLFIIASVPIATVLEGIGISLGLGLLAGLAPALIAGRMDIVDAIRRRA
jgi:putative ABC transport system permease protein